MRANARLPGRVAAATVLFILASLFHGALARQPSPTIIEQGQFMLSDALLPPPDDAPWQPVKLPDNWNLSRPGKAGVGWYRLIFDIAPETRATHTIYLPRNSARSLGFFLNGRHHAGNVAYGDPGARSWAPPLIYTIPGSTLNPGPNVLHIRVEAVPEVRQGLTRVVIAQGATGRALYEKRYALQVITLYMFGAAALICGLLAAAFWSRQRGDSTLLWFAVTAFAWAVASFPWLHAAFTPPIFNHGPLAFLARFAYAAPMLVLCLRAAGRRWPWPEAALWAFTLTGLVLVWLIVEERQGFIITCWSVTYLIALLVLLVVLIRSQRRQRKWSASLLAASLVLAILLGVHDLAWWLGWVDYDSLELAHFHIPLVLFAIGATILEQHFQAVEAAKRARSGLEARVEEKTREIEANYARIREAEHEKALARERQRIMADMHDGLGSSLVGLLGAVQSGKAGLPEVERRVYDALQELRLAVDALEPMDGDLGVVLGNVRHRMRAAIESSGVRFHWQIGELPHYSDLSPAAVLAIQRIVLEALTNALRHAQAVDVTVSTEVSGRWLKICVMDNGIGFDEAHVSRGRGLESLRRRARGLGGDVEIRSRPGEGTAVTLRLPLEGATRY